MQDGEDEDEDKDEKRGQENKMIAGERDAGIFIRWCLFTSPPAAPSILPNTQPCQAKKKEWSEATTTVIVPPLPQSLKSFIYFCTTQRSHLEMEASFYPLLPCCSTKLQLSARRLRPQRPSSQLSWHKQIIPLLNKFGNGRCNDYLIMLVMVIEGTRVGAAATATRLGTVSHTSRGAIVINVSNSHKCAALEGSVVVMGQLLMLMLIISWPFLAMCDVPVSTSFFFSIIIHAAGTSLR